MNLSNLSDADLLALKENRINDVSTAGLQQMKADYMQRIGEADFQKSLDPTKGMSSREKYIAGMGASFADLVLGVKQRMGLSTEQDATDKQITDKPLLDTTAGKFGKVSGDVAKGLTLGLLPFANTYGGAALGGGLYGLAEPTTQTDSVLGNVAKNSVLNAGGLALGRGLFGGLAGNNNGPVRQMQVDTARRYDIPMTAGQQTGNPALQAIESQLATLPMGGSMSDLMRRGRETYASRVMKQGGAQPGALATVAENQIARDNLRANYRDIWSRNNVTLDNQFSADVNRITREARRNLNDADFRVYMNNLRNVMQRDSGGSIPGDVYQRTMRQELDRVGGLAGDYVTQLRGALDATATRSVSRADAQALRDTNRAYAVNRTLEPVVNRAEGRGGVFSPDEVRAAVGSFNGPPGELARIGPLFRDLPNSGTANRALVNQLLLSGAGGVLGGGAGYATGGNEGGLAGLLSGLAAPLAASQVLSSSLGRNALARGVIPARGAAGVLSNTAIRPFALGVPAVPALIPAEQ